MKERLDKSFSSFHMLEQQHLETIHPNTYLWRPVPGQARMRSTWENLCDNNWKIPPTNSQSPNLVYFLYICWCSIKSLKAYREFRSTLVSQYKKGNRTFKIWYIMNMKASNVFKFPKSRNVEFWYLESIYK